ncbi:hypothetical protein bb8_p15 [Bordetella phage vB_BbrP_BB8]|uniref:Uncharacterized protein n=1 Tax=Bordetella phage vB_BbrP_BB8 TaxID=2587820 RepID=A0A4Y5TQX1_9CAUD|nr:hypothetical protein bb8_p15 [Bordetella phage vB_BbrP_BB8]
MMEEAWLAFLILYGAIALVACLMGPKRNP